jgi:hypothetical protein
VGFAHQLCVRVDIGLNPFIISYFPSFSSVYLYKFCVGLLSKWNKFLIKFRPATHNPAPDKVNPKAFKRNPPTDNKFSPNVLEDSVILTKSSIDLTPYNNNKKGIAISEELSTIK